MNEVNDLSKAVKERLNKPSYYIVEVGYTQYVYDTLEFASEFAMSAFVHSTKDVTITLTKTAPKED